MLAGECVLCLLENADILWQLRVSSGATKTIAKCVKICIKGGLAERDGLQTGKEVMELEVNCLYLRFLKLLGK